MELNNTIAKPLYKQLEDQLKEEIDTGKRKAGSRLPTENELSTTYNVSRVTVRKALAGLSELGYLANPEKELLLPKKESSEISQKVLPDFLKCAVQWEQFQVRKPLKLQ